MTKQIVDYKVVSRYGNADHSDERMARDVKNSIDDGWQPYGRLIYKRGNYIQAMVKYAAAVSIVAISVIALILVVALS